MPGPLTDTTPCVANRTQQTAPSRLNLDIARPLVLLDFGKFIPQIPVDYFFDNLLPRLHQGLPGLDHVLNNLGEPQQHGTDSSAILKDGRWSCFPVDPSRDGRWENDVYHRLEQLTDKIHVAGCLPDGKRTVIFRCNPNMAPRSSLRGNLSKSDGYGIVTGTDVKNVQWHQIAFPAEFKKNESDADDVSTGYLVRRTLN